jgi:phage-related protein
MPPSLPNPIALAGSAVSGVKDLVEKDLSEAFAKLKKSIELLKPSFEAITAAIGSRLVKSFDQLQNATAAVVSKLTPMTVGLGSLGSGLVTAGAAFAGLLGPVAALPAAMIAGGVATLGLAHAFGDIPKAFSQVVSALKPLAINLDTMTVEGSKFGTALQKIYGPFVDLGTKIAKFATDVREAARYTSYFTDQVKYEFQGLFEKVKKPLGEFSHGFLDSIAKAFPKTFNYKPPAETAPEAGGFGSLGKHAAPGTAANPFTLEGAGAATEIESLGAEVGGALSGLVAGLAGLAEGVTVVAGVAIAAVVAVIGLGEAMAQFVSKASPGHVVLFTNALDDLVAVIGYAMIPAFQVVTQVVRLVGDTLTTFAGEIGGSIGRVFKSLLPSVRPVLEILGRIGQAVARAFDGLEPGIEALNEAVGAIIESVRPVADFLIDLIGGSLKASLHIFSAAVEILVAPITYAANACAAFYTWLVEVAHQLLSLVGIDIKGEEANPGASVGKSVKQANIGSVESVIATAQKNAFTLGTGGSPEERSAGSLAEIHKMLQNWPTKLAKAIVDAIEGRLPPPVAAAGSAVAGDRGLVGTGYKSGSRTVDQIVNTTVGLPVTAAVGAISSLFGKK